MNILGIDIDESSRDEIHERVDYFLREDAFHRVATVNPEFLVEADRNPEFRRSLRSADLRVADGSGVVLVSLLSGRRITRYPGADLLGYILAKAERRRLPVFLAVREDGLSSFSEIRNVLLKIFPGLIVGGNEWRMKNGGWESCEGASFIMHHASCILLCNFGAPEQEYFLEGLRKEGIPSRLGMGVGGAFDFLTGKRKRAPGWLRAVGLEWLWRLIREPRRAGRIWNATAVFLWKILLEKKKNSR
ncbi:MAG: WecB/TagA/CpsF family glycosyltransferase [Candidatus Moranbacteria bacterium]|nr:WecB/TagA/CpsF family glycosyltransferase [Candidatus Moranbacteria bacterium]